MIRTERLAAVGKLAAGVAHQFNNLATPIMGYADLLQRRLELDEKSTRWLQLIETASIRARDITHNLLIFAQLRKARIKSNADINRVVIDTSALVEHNLSGEGIKLDIELDTLPQIKADSSELSQVVLNFLINAEHALIGISKPAIKISTGIDSGEIFIRVEDNGCGIPKEQQEVIFNPFFSTKGEFSEQGSRQSAVRGTGLGLSVCHAIMEQHDGRITVEYARPRQHLYRLVAHYRNGNQPAGEGQRALPVYLRANSYYR